MRRHNLPVLALLVASLAGCQTSTEPDDEVQAEPSGRGVVRISASDQAAIGLATSSVTRRQVQNQLELVGWLAAKPGLETIVKAPAAGFVTAPEGGRMAIIGDRVHADDPLATLQVFLSPQEQAQLISTKEDADTAMKQATVSMELASAQLDRLKSAPNTLSGMQIDQLREIYERSKVAHQEAQEKLPFLPVEPYNGPLKLEPVAINSPMNGRIIQLHVSSRQLVAAGDPIWTLADWSVLWVRVPVFEGDLPRIGTNVTAHVTPPGIHDSVRATRLDIPQPAIPGQRTVDVWFELQNSHESLRPGQSVSVDIPIGDAQEKVVVPRDAIVWDGMGSAWVYSQIGPESFDRQRVETGANVDDGVVIERGLTGGEIIVTAAVGLLYGEEFKGDLNVDDD